MQTIDAIYTGGKFEPLVPVHLPENERVRITVQPEPWQKWLAMAKSHQARIEAAHGILPDSTPIIAEYRGRDA